MSIRKPLSEITASDLEEFFNDKEPESKTLDYKTDLFLKASEVKDELRKDITSFANTSGGDYIIGIREDKGQPVEMKGVELANPDAFKLQLEEVLQSNITPRLPQRPEVQPMLLPNGNYVVIVRIARSFNPPHQVKINKDDFQFWARNSAGKYRLDVDELRNQFLASQTLREQIRAFRMDRLAAITAGETPVPLLSSRAKVIGCVAPVADQVHLRHDASQVCCRPEYRRSSRPRADAPVRPDAAPTPARSRRTAFGTRLHA